MRRRGVIVGAVLFAVAIVFAAQTFGSSGKLRERSTDASCALPDGLRRDQPVSGVTTVDGEAAAYDASGLVATGIAVQVGGTRKVAEGTEGATLGLDLDDPRVAPAESDDRFPGTTVAIAVVVDRVLAGSTDRCRRIVLPGARTDGAEPGHPGSYWPGLDVPEPGDRVVLVAPATKDRSRPAFTSIVVTTPDGLADVAGTRVDTAGWPALR